MFERFTDRSRQIVAMARAEAETLDHDYIGTEHLLLALINLEGGVSRAVLTSRNYSAEALRDHLSHDSKSRYHGRDIPFTPRAKKVLELSLREALQLGHRAIDEYHLLLGILRMDESTAISMLSLDGDTAKVTGLRQAIIEASQPTIPTQQAADQSTSDENDTATTSNATLIAAIVKRLATKPESELRSLLDSLG